MPIYNCHIHIFSKNCVPERFLDVALPEWMDFAASPIKGFLETRFGRWITGGLARNRAKGGFLKTAARYSSFVSIGTMSDQRDVFRLVLEKNGYPSDTRFVVLTLNMDEMGAGTSELVYKGQLQKVAELRKQYPNQCLPFLSVDPRSGTETLHELLDLYIGTGVDAQGPYFKAFVGLKLYPALGYFPFDKRLEECYQTAQALGLPLMTHCTRSGSYYVGKRTVTITQPTPITYQNNGVENRPDYNSEFFVPIQGDDLAASCVFGKPSAWRFVLENYPELKLCFAHMGGGSEVFHVNARDFSKDPGWFGQVLYMMGRYQNVYTDISYTLSYKKDRDPDAFFRLVASLLEGDFDSTYPNELLTQDPFTGAPVDVSTLPYWNTVPKRVLFGTDFFMTEQEARESSLSHEFSDWLRNQNKTDLWDQLSETNPVTYLTSKVWG
ncbi:amidohydrolase family protein [Nostoc sp. NIES-2111]